MLTIFRLTTVSYNQIWNYDSLCVSFNPIYLKIMIDTMFVLVCAKQLTRNHSWKFITWKDKFPGNHSWQFIVCRDEFPGNHSWKFIAWKVKFTRATNNSLRGIDTERFSSFLRVRKIAEFRKKVSYIPIRLPWILHKKIKMLIILRFRRAKIFIF